MGVIKKGILGGFKGKVGTVVGANWKGLDTVRSMPSSVANPRSAGQVLNRSKFKYISTFASLILATVVRPFWNGKNAYMSGYNSFIKANVENGTSDQGIEWNQLKMTQGSLVGVDVDAVVANDGDTTVTVTFTDNSGVGNAVATDKISCVIMNLDTYTISQAIKSVQRSAGSISVVCPELVQGEELKIYLFASKLNDDAIVSNSDYSGAQVA